MSGLLTPGAAAEALGISVDQLAKLTDKGKLPYVDVGISEKRPARRYEPADIEAFKLLHRRIKSPPSNVAPPIKRSRSTSRSEVYDLQAIRSKLVSERLAASRR